MEGSELCARFGIAPNLRGYCGKSSFPRALKKYLEKNSKEHESRLEKELKNFQVHYSYLGLIARANGIGDPFDYEVAQALWIGNRLLGGVGREDVVEMISGEWVEKGIVPKAKAAGICRKLPKICPPVHHSFHVYFVEFVSGKAGKTAGNKDRCRPSWGRIVDSDGASFTVERRPVEYAAGGKYAFGAKKQVRIDAVPGSIRLVPRDAGLAAVHWGCAVKEINSGEEKRLERYTRLVLDAKNKALSAGA